MSVIVLEMYAWLDEVLKGNVTVPDEVFDRFADRCRDGLKKHILDDRGAFTLRMSNIGRDLRQLMLEKQYGRGTPTPDFLLKMLDGTLQEALLLFIIEAAGIAVTDTDKKVKLEIAGTILEGTYDIKFKLGNKVWDFKTASAYSYEHKFNTWKSLADKDDFGYMGQGFGYAKADNAKFGGWIVKNKNTGDIKAVEIPDHVHDELSKKHLEIIADKILYINNPANPIPACKGAVEETFYKKPTGNVVLGDSCRFCSHKELCHPGIQYLPSQVGKGSGYKWYVKVKD